MERCFLCKSKNTLIEFENKYICKECYAKLLLCEASDIAYQEWKVSINNFDTYEDGVDLVINRILDDIKLESNNEKKQKLILRKIKDMIHLHLKYYNKDELYIAMLAIRESIRRLLLKDKSNYDWAIISDITTTITLMSIIQNIADDEYEDNALGKLENGASNLITAICMARRYNTIKENIQLTKDEDIAINEICFNPIETEETNKYFDQYLKNCIAEKPEDYIIKNTVLKDKLEKEGKTPDSILESLREVIKNEFGFEREDYRTLAIFLMIMEFPTEKMYWEYLKSDNKLFENFPLIVIEKNIMEEVCGKEQLEAILDTFSINRNINQCEFNKKLELLSFYETDKFIIFGNFDFAQNISAFEKFLLSNDYIDVLKKNISQKKVFTKSQKKMSQYLSISVADYLYYTGYKLPMEKYKDTLIPRAEIDKVKVNGKQLLATCGDIDVLALDSVKKVVILFEIKYYKPAISTTDMLYKDKSRIDKDEVIRKMEKREEIVYENIDEIVKYVLGKYEPGYKVKSILLTPRTNYYAIKEEKLDYLTWAEFIEKADNNQL
ncbi:Uncharacterised protein [[Clostridium] sordellii]|uniref:hypothetical protein n=1 Tax=Paraclostridium sordellii TaxID=1505 RepID=UPI0005E85118|nr:hypothetical protein [Paeniclostridium sordellii]CEQ29790.1 Uncharacterised protein [[Clostridium] sordellii] [Paeniclostridium sordellii]